MKEQLISFETAKLAKNKELCKYFNSGTQYVNAFYSEDGINYEETEFQQEDCIIEDRYYRPTQSLLQKWLRENNIIIEINFSKTSDPKYCFIVYKYIDFGNWEDIKNPDWGLYGKYEDALEDGLQLSLKSM